MHVPRNRICWKLQRLSVPWRRASHGSGARPRRHSDAPPMPFFGPLRVPSAPIFPAKPSAALRCVDSEAATTLSPSATPTDKDCRHRQADTASTWVSRSVQPYQLEAWRPLDHPPSRSTLPPNPEFITTKIRKRALTTTCYHQYSRSLRDVKRSHRTMKTATKNPHEAGFIRLIGGGGRNRTGVDGFAGRCMTTLPPRRAATAHAIRTQRRNEKGEPYQCLRALPQGNGAGNESRTRDLNLGKVALYQLSYSRVGQP